jgi:D-alanyl-D-alanine carboxypeptidase
VNRQPWLALLALVVSACVSVEPPQPTTTVIPVTPTPTASQSPTPSPTPSSTATASPTASPSLTPTTSPTATASPSAVDPVLAGELQAALDALRAQDSVPGMSAALIMPDGARWEGVSGQSSVDPAAPVSADTVFVAGSITKTFVAATVMQLADDGVLDIDDTLATWLPTFPRASEISLRTLLSHTSGVFNYFEHPSYNRLVFGDPAHVWTPQEILDRLVVDDSYCDPGTCYHYSNTGYLLLGLLIEAVTGATLGDELRRRWIEPLGLDETFFQDDTPLPPDAAYGHLIRRDDRLIEFDDGTNYRPTTSAATVAWAAGAMAATGDDLADWCRALYGGDLLSAAALAEMTDFAANPYSDEAYGLGTRTRLLDGRRMVGHTGSLRGFYTAMWHFPAENLTVVVMLNLGRIDPNPMADRLARLALEAAGYPAPTPSVEPSTSPSPLPLP